MPYPVSNISVALCTYNGSQFLHEQLASIAAQTLHPAELVLFDDCSTDDTLAVAQRFAETAAFPVRIHANPRNLGVRDNFAECIAQCTGTIIALSDQDDVWLPHKLERLSRALGEHPDAAFVFSNAHLVDPNLKPIPYSLWEAIRLQPNELARFQDRQGFDVLLKRQVVTGATMAFRASYRDVLLPIPTGWLHDGWIALILSAISWGVPVEEALISYRQHARQQVGERRRSIYQQYQIARTKGPADFERVAGAIKAATERLENGAPHAKKAIEALRAKSLHAERRLRIHESGGLRLPLIAGEWWSGNYKKFSPGWKAVAQDLFL